MSIAECCIYLQNFNVDFSVLGDKSIYRNSVEKYLLKSCHYFPIILDAKGFSVDIKIGFVFISIILSLVDL